MNLLPAITSLSLDGPAASEVTAEIMDEGRAIHVKGSITPVAGQDRYCLIRCGIVSLPAGTYTLANSEPSTLPALMYIQLVDPESSVNPTNKTPRFTLKGGGYPLQIVTRTATPFDVTITPSLVRLEGDTR
ncbi:hypothetical protein [Bifidobacterium sp. SO1]|uniref:hypothetical protein n=1 Tax=Bifidobacterium sp. SO1 TaxID=2809029 RepID=UPI001BDCBCEF|nr:hypothetical protein [Bifidobacterium sp. SO1]MBT1161214.1 hypothetical protein [Bifidobacterium sp. SO1]